MLRLARRHGWLVVPVLAPLVVFAPAVAGRALLAPGDGVGYYLPLHRLVASMLRAGEAPWWNPYSFSGSPLFALHQAGVLYPPNLVHLVLPPVAAENLVALSSLAVAATGAALLGRRLTGDRLGGTVCGVAFGLSGFFVAHLVHPSILATTAWLPWAVLGLEHLRERPSPGRLALAAAPVTLAALAGHGQMLAFLATVVLAYGVALGRRPALLAGLAVVAGMGVAGLQLGPVVAGVGETDRSSLGYELATTFAFEPSSLPLLAFPMLAGGGTAGPFDEPYAGPWNRDEVSGYPGAAVWVLAAVGVVAVRRDRRALALVVIGGLALVVALGASTPLAAVVHALPVFGRFRSWARYAVGLDLAVAVLAAYGAVELRRAGGRARAATAVALLVLLAAATAHVPAIARLRPPDAGMLAVVLPLVAALAALVVVLAARRSPRLALLAAVAVVAVDLAGSNALWASWRLAPTPARYEALLAADDPPYGPVPDAPGGVDRVLSVAGDTRPLGLAGPPATDPLGVSSAGGNDPLAPDRYLRAVGDMDYSGAVPRPERLLAVGAPVLDLLRVSLVVAHPPTTPSFVEVDAALGPGERVALDRTVVVRYERTPQLPEAFVVADAGRLDPTALAGTAEVVRRSPTRVEVAVDAATPGTFVLSAAFDPGWRATVDGRQVDVVRVADLVQGVPVGAGPATVVLRYEPPGLRIGAATTAASLIALVGWGVAALSPASWPRRRGGSSARRPSAGRGGG